MKRRLKAEGYFAKGIRAAEVAHKLGVRRQAAHQWKQAWEKGGKEALQSKGPVGPKGKLSQAQREEIVEALLAGPAASGYATEVWTLPRVKALIRRQTSQNYHPSHVGRLLRSMGFSCQRPERRAIERDEKAIAHWKRVEWPEIKKSPRQKRLIVFLYESGLSTRPHRVRT